MGVHARSVALAERMGNWDADEARRYHERTKHSPESVRASAHYLDWGNRPQPFKEYEGIEPLPLSDELTQPQRAALDAIADGAGRTPAPLALPDLARPVRWGAGVVRTQRLAGGETYHFRTYSSAGALYPIELYVACADLRGSRRASTTFTRSSWRSARFAQATFAVHSRPQPMMRTSPTRRPCSF
jgi:hypothetical protein